MSEERVKQLETQLQAYKEDRFCQGGCVVYQYDKIRNLTAENKRLREALEKINKVKLYNMPVIQGYGEKNYLKWYDLEHSAGLNMQSLAQQALGE